MRLPAPCSPARSGPTLVADPVNAVSGVGKVTPPADGRPWASYELTVCVNGATPANCRTLTPVCTANADQSQTDCTIPGCIAETTYDVTAVAIQADGSISAVSNLDPFTTPKYP